MSRVYCNPLDLNYRYQHVKEGGPSRGFREGADPTLVLFHGIYYLFVSMSAGFWYSEDLLDWNFQAAPDLLIYDYAPDVRQIGEYLYFSASRRGVNCPILRTKDPLREKFEEVSCSFDFWDPDLFVDDDGRVYFYWGCTNTDPIWGVEMDPVTMTPLGEKRALIFDRETELGYERFGENGTLNERENSVAYQHLKQFFNPTTQKLELPPEMAQASAYSEEALTKMFLSIGRPYMEGAFMTKHAGKYYLQYACPGTEYNTYCDGVYVSDAPLGPFTLQKSNPFSSNPGGFIAAAGHGSTIQDKSGNWWHAATMRISVNHNFERRIGLFPAGFDEDGILFCNQNFADYPHRLPEGAFDPAAWEPEWMLLSYKKPVVASSTAVGSDPALAVNEDIRSWWSAAEAGEGQWICVDLGRTSDVRAIQVNLADEDVEVDFPPESYGDERHTRHIDLEPQISHYTLEISENGTDWTSLERVERECSNGFYVYENGFLARYVRLTGGALPYDQPLRVSGLRIFGIGDGAKPAAAKAAAKRLGDLDAVVTWERIPDAQGCNVRYGIAPDKLYLSWLVYDADQVRLSTLMKDTVYYARVDSFNENGVTEGEVIRIQESD